MIKLVAFDVDGTLRERDFLPESTRNALKHLKEQGVILALCTGRSEFEIASLREELGIDWAITCNGSHIGHQGTTVFGTAFEANTVLDWLQHAQRQQHSLLLYGSEGMFTNDHFDTYFRQAQQEIGFMEPIPLHTLDYVPDIYQCIVFCESADEHLYVGTGLNPYYMHRWRPWALDINPSGMNKAIGLQKLIDHLGLAFDEVAAVGDGLNDLEMIESVGMGIAMGNADESLKLKARYVTRSLREDGIAYAVQTWIL